MKRWPCILKPSFRFSIKQDLYRIVFYKAVTYRTNLLHLFFTMKFLQRLGHLRLGRQLPVRRFCQDVVPRGQVLCGKTVAKDCRKRVKKQVKEFQEIVGRAPGLAVLLVGNRPDSAAYVMSKTKTCAKLGMPR